MSNILDLQLPQLHCHVCGHEWVQRVTDPKACPRCHSKYWNKGRTRAERSDKGIKREVKR